MKQEYVIVWIMRFVHTSKAKIRSAYFRFRKLSKQFFRSKEQVVAEPKPWMYEVPYPKVNNNLQKPKQSIWPYLIFAVIVVGFVGLIAVACVNLDEGYWMVNGKLFLTAIEKKDWLGTYVSTDAAHPGVTVMWISALIWKIFTPSGEAINHLHRLVFFLVRFSGIGLILYLLLKKFKVSSQPIILVGIYLAFNAYIGIGLKATWLDQLLATSIALASICWFIYLKEKSDQWVVGAGVFWGLALATKIMALFWVPMMGVLTLIYFPKFWQHLNIVWAGLKVGIIGILIYFILFPAAVIKPFEVPLSRFVGDVAKQHVEVTIGGSGIAQTATFYPTQWFTAEGTVGIGIVLVIYFIIRNRNKAFANYSLIGFGIVGTVYVLMLLVPALLLKDSWGDKDYAYLATRYMAPAIPLMSIWVFGVINQTKISRVGIIIMVVLFGLTLNQIPLVSNLAAVEQFLLRFVF